MYVQLRQILLPPVCIDALQYAPRIIVHASHKHIRSRHGLVGHPRTCRCRARTRVVSEWPCLPCRASFPSPVDCRRIYASFPHRQSVSNSSHHHRPYYITHSSSLTVASPPQPFPPSTHPSPAHAPLPPHPLLHPLPPTSVPWPTGCWARGPS